MDDPRGGVRHVLPARGNYKRVASDWGEPPGRGAAVGRIEPLTTGRPGPRLGDFLGTLFRQAEEATVVSAFVQNSGLDILEPTFEQFLRKGGVLHLVTGDYLHFTQADALQRLLDLQARTQAYSTADDPDEQVLSGRFEVLVVEAERLKRAFHPKAWIFAWGAEPRDGVAYVGSSNLSRSALEHGVEWNLRVERRLDPTSWDRVYEAAATLRETSTPLDAEWLADYRVRAKRAARPLPLGEVEDDSEPAPEPRDVQVEALAALRECRESGVRRALVVMATGLGKTFLAAFDVDQFRETLGRDPRVLLLAHRRELLTQAAGTFRRVLPDLSFSWCLGSSSDVSGDIVFASVQKLSRPRILDGIARDYFDYVIVDEVHHAAAATYRRILDALDPAFLLGLTATPDRADEADILGLFDDHIPYRADLALGVSRGLLVPFEYEGIRDTVDYAPIPWRSGRFDPKALSTAVQSEQRMTTLWEAWERLPGSRTLIFCASIDHAVFARDWLRKRGVRIEAIHSRRDSYDRADGLRDLENGALDALCTVDLFNEGIDCKPIDRVVMLRPTESPVVFLQQLGRGLRICEGKSALQVIDFVGNHRVFLNRLRTLLSLGGEPPALRAFLEGKVAASLPQGCSLRVEFEAIDLLRKLLPASSKNELVRVYRELREARQSRPKAGELQRMGLNPASVRTGHGSWFGFVQDEDDLTEAERTAFSGAEAWLAHLERTAMTKCFKMVVLEVLVASDRLRSGISLAELAAKSHAYISRSPELLADLEGVKELDDTRDSSSEAWLRYWNRNPVRAWTTADKRGRAWFAVEGDRFVARIPFPPDSFAAAALVAMTTELVDWRLARYRKRRRGVSQVESGTLTSFRIKVLRNASGDPILHFGNRKDRELLPLGETDVRLQDGSIWQFRFVKIACNVARPVGAQRNQLADLLRRWFGPEAGKAGTDRSVEFRRSPDGWWVEAVGSNVIAMPLRGRVVAYPSLRAAAGVLSGDDLQGEGVEAEEVRLPGVGPDQDVFAVRATGDSMDGGATPIRDGDWVLMRWARGKGLGAVQGRIALLGVGDPTEDRQFLLKRVVSSDSGVVLRSENRDYAELPTSRETQVMALQTGVVRPEDLAPGMGAVIAAGEVAGAFGLQGEPTEPWCRVDGHLFVFIDGPGALVAPDRLRFEGGGRRPGETAFLLTRKAEGWRYAGVGRRLVDEGLWGLPDVDFDTWRSLGKGRSASKRLDPKWLERAGEVATELAEREATWVEARGKRCRIRGASAKGGVRIDGGPEGLKERTVSRLDLAWVLRARDEAQKVSGVVDEAVVNRLRYLEGTPKGSTRWIDTGWALVLTGATAVR
jgi:superfamily II DNA or RNA helicase